MVNLVTRDTNSLYTVRSDLHLKVRKEDKDAVFYCESSYFVPDGMAMTESIRINITVHCKHYLVWLNPLNPKPWCWRPPLTLICVISEPRHATVRGDAVTSALRPKYTSTTLLCGHAVASTDSFSFMVLRRWCCKVLILMYWLTESDS